MFVLQICIGILVAVGLAFVLADVYHLPTLKARKATNNLGKKGDKKVSISNMKHRRKNRTFPP